MTTARILIPLVTLLSVGCVPDPRGGEDTHDTAPQDTASEDTASEDTDDTGSHDTASDDTASDDTASHDTATDTGPADTGTVDTALDTGTDTGTVDTGADTGTVDTGTVDSGAPEDADGDGWTVADGDCDDTDADVYPGALEWPDGIDNNCNGEVDEAHWVCIP